MVVIETSRKAFYSRVEENLRPEFLESMRIMNRGILEDKDLQYLDDFVIKLKSMFGEFKCEENLKLNRNLSSFFMVYHKHKQLGQERLEKLLCEN